MPTDEINIPVKINSLQGKITSVFKAIYFSREKPGLYAWKKN